MQYLLGLPTLITVLALLFMGAITIRSGNKLPNKFFIFFVTVDCLWLLSVWIVNTTGFGLDVFWSRLAFVAPIFFVVALNGFVSALLNISHGTIYKIVIQGFGAILAATTLLTDLIIYDVRTVYDADSIASPFPDYGQAIIPYIIYIALGSLVLCFTLIFHTKRLSKEARNVRNVEVRQIKMISSGLIGFVLISLLTNLLLPTLIGNAWPSQFAPIGSLILAITFFYAVMRYKLFDIKPAVIRGTAYLILMTILALVFVSFVNLSNLIRSLLGINQDFQVFFSTAIVLVIAASFHPLKRLFDKITNSIFYRDAYKTQDFFASLSELLASTTDLRGLLQRAAQHIAAALKVEQAFFYVYYTNSTQHHLSAGTKDHARLPLYDVKVLDSYVNDHKKRIFLTDYLPNKDEDIRRLLVSHGIALLLPLRLRDKTIGYLCLGDTRAESFSQRDLNVLKTIADELVIAIQNALLVHEVKEINATLQQRIQVATAELRESNAQLHRLDTAKNEFVSMASHQLRTPLTSVKGYISMMLDGDVGKISDAQRSALQEAFNSSERMVRLIGDFLSVSRLQTGKFMIEKKPIDLVKVIAQEVDGLRIIASTHGQKLAFVHPKKSLVIAIDEAKIRQVIMNFIDNAIYYSRADSTIHVSLSRLEDEVVFTVEDTGIGVPPDEQHKLFNKFYRATNARQQRPDGTGVGLFLAKKIITAHDGKIIFSSTVGQGSTFGFRLPLNQSDEPDDHNGKP